MLKFHHIYRIVNDIPFHEPLEAGLKGLPRHPFSFVTAVRCAAHCLIHLQLIVGVRPLNLERNRR